MKIKVDDIVNIQVAKSGKSLTRIAQDIDLSRVQLSKILKNPDMEIKYVMAIGKSIRFDFSRYFPELNAERLSRIVDEPLEPVASMGNQELRDKIIDLQGKYVTLLEEHIKLLHKVSESGLQVN